MLGERAGGKELTALKTVAGIVLPVIALILAAGALLRMLNEVPDRILSPSKNVIHYQDVRQVKRILGIPIIVPSYLPPNLVPTPGAIESTGEPEFKVVLRYKFRTHDAYALIIE